MRFDIDAIEQSTKSTFDVVVGYQPGADGGQGDPIGFRVVGPGSEQFEQVERSLQIARVKIANGRKEPIDMSTDAGAAIVVDEGDEHRDLVLFSCTVGWFGFTQGDKPAEFTRENLARVFRARPHWARIVVNAIQNAANFEGA